MKYTIQGLIFLISLVACNSTDRSQNDHNPGENKQTMAPLIGFSVINTYPHDTTFFTEGLEWHEGRLLESSGGDNVQSPYPSGLGILDIKTGKVEMKVVLDKRKYFGEGITVFNNKLYQLTWKSKVGFIYDAKTFKKIREFPLPSPEGWGLTHDSSRLIMSDGSNSIYFLHPDSLQVMNIVGVLDNNGPVANINELEWVDGFIYANQWQTPYILKIDPQSGKVVGKLDFTKIVSDIQEKHDYASDLNGIAYKASSNSFFVVGKKWPVIYEIKLL